MDARIGPAIIIAAVFVAVVALMALGWRARRRRQADLPAPVAATSGNAGEEIASWTGVHYVATSTTGDALDRIAVGGLGYRGRADVAVHEGGILIAIAGEESILIPVAAIDAVEEGTATIDRAVETGGLSVVRWTLGTTPAGDELPGAKSVETALRIVDRDARADFLRHARDLVAAPAAPRIESEDQS